MNVLARRRPEAEETGGGRRGGARGVRGFASMGVRRVGTLAAGLVALVATGASPAAVGGEPQGPGVDQFRPCAKAWEGRDAAGVAQCVREKDGRVDVSLLGARDKPVSGRYTRESLERALSRYFDAIEKVRLEDKTPTSTPNASTRTYDYSYRPKDGEERTTRLTITLAADGDGRFCLVALSERPRPK